jgi:hypothetical protein
VGVVDPREARGAQPIRRQGGEVETPAASGLEGDRVRDPAREQRATAVDRVAGVAPQHRAARTVRVEDRERQVEDRLLAARRGQHVAVGIDLDAVAGANPVRDGRPQRRLPGGGGVAADGTDRVPQRVADERWRGLVGIADREVGERLPVGPQVVGEVLQPCQGVATELLEGGVRGHHGDGA